MGKVARMFYSIAIVIVVYDDDDDDDVSCQDEQYTFI